VAARKQCDQQQIDHGAITDVDSADLIAQLMDALGQQRQLAGL
jgi:hypothetical protein